MYSTSPIMRSAMGNHSDYYILAHLMNFFGSLQIASLWEIIAMPEFPCSDVFTFDKSHFAMGNHSISCILVDYGHFSGQNRGPFSMGVHSVS